MEAPTLNDGTPIRGFFAAGRRFPGAGRSGVLSSALSGAAGKEGLVCGSR